MDRKRILIIDDEPAFLMAVKKMLHSPEFLIATAESLDDAMSLFNAQQFDTVITDIRLTDVMRDEGMEILQYVKGNKPGTRVIVLTGYGNPQIMKRAYSLGADLYLEKPVSVNVLRNIIESQRMTDGRPVL